MAREDPVETAVRVCLERAGNAKSQAERLAFMLYAEIIPGLVRWEAHTKGISAGDYLIAISSSAATLCAHGIKNATFELPHKTDEVTEMVIESVTMRIMHEVETAPIAAVLGKLNG